MAVGKAEARQARQARQARHRFVDDPSICWSRSLLYSVTMYVSKIETVSALSGQDQASSHVG